MPQISIIVPVYKAEKYIGQCVDSILAQTFTDFELILVEDGSPDNCGEICDEYASIDSRVRVIHQRNAGVSAARNRGLESAVGDYICFVDSDDIVDCEYCEVLHGMIQASSNDFSACGIQRFFEGEIPVGNEEKYRAVYSNVDFLIGQINRESEISPCNKLFRRKALKNIRFVENYRYEDVIFSIDLAKNLRNGAIFTNRELYYYRLQADSFMSVQALSKLDDFVMAGEYLIAAAKTHFPEHLATCLRYATAYPWGYIDSVYVKATFAQNRALLDSLQNLLRINMDDYRKYAVFTGVQLKRMALFARSRFLYGFNAYTRLARVYLYRLIGKDAYADGHGI